MNIDPSFVPHEQQLKLSDEPRSYVYNGREKIKDGLSVVFMVFVCAFWVWIAAQLGSILL